MNITKKNLKYVWIGVHEKSFKELNKKLYEARILTLPGGVDDFSNK